MADINEIVSREAIKGVERLEKATKQTAKQVQTLYDVSKKLDTELKGLGISTKSVKDTQQKLNDVQKKALKINNDVVNVRKKVTQVQNGEIDSLIKLKSRLQQATNETKKAMEVERSKTAAWKKSQKATEQSTVAINKNKQIIKLQAAVNAAAKGSYDKLAARLSLNIAKYKALSAAQMKSSKGQALIKNIQKQDKELKKLNKTMGRSQGFVGAYGEAFQKAFLKIGLAVAGAVAAFKMITGVVGGSIERLKKQERAEFSLTAAIKNRGETTKMTYEELRKEATRLQSISVIGDEDILKGITSQLLTFTQISDEVFKDAQEAVMDIATTLSQTGEPAFTELKSVALQLGKALNDPIGQMGALSRSGIMFSAENKKVIKSLAASGKMAEAQALMLKEVNAQYGGQFAAMAQSTGIINQTKNMIGDLSEEFGRFLMKGIYPAVKGLQGVVKWLQKMIVVSPVDDIKNQQKEMNILAIRLRDVNLPTDERNKLIKRMNDISPALIKGLEDEDKFYENLTKNVDEFNKKVVTRIRLAGIDKEEAKALNKLAKERAGIESTREILATKLFENAKNISKLENFSLIEKSKLYEEELRAKIQSGKQDYRTVVLQSGQTRQIGIQSELLDDMVGFREMLERQIENERTLQEDVNKVVTKRGALENILFGEKDENIKKLEELTTKQLENLTDEQLKYYNITREKANELSKQRKVLTDEEIAALEKIAAAKKRLETVGQKIDISEIKRAGTERLIELQTQLQNQEITQKEFDEKKIENTYETNQNVLEQEIAFITKALDNKLLGDAERLDLEDQLTGKLLDSQKLFSDESLRIARENKDEVLEAELLANQAAIDAAQQKANDANAAITADLLFQKQRYAQGIIDKKEYEAIITQLERDKNLKIIEGDISVMQTQKDILQKQLKNSELLPDQKKKLNDELIIVEENLAQLQMDLDDMVADNAIENIDKVSEKEKEAAEAAEELAQLKFETKMMLANATFEFGSMIGEKQLMNLQEQKEAELAIAGDNATEKERIEEEYGKKVAKIKMRQAILDKAQALFNIFINTWMGVVAAASNPLTLPLVPWIKAQGYIAAALVAAKPIPKFGKGVKSSPKGLAEVGEAGRELGITPKGQSFLTDEKQIINLEKGTRIFNNKETEEILNMDKSGKLGFDMSELMDSPTGYSTLTTFNEMYAQLDSDGIISAIGEGNEKVVDTIKRKKELHIYPSKQKIVEREGGYFKEYWNTKIRM